ncbi:hypothetical protein EI94DRAFT_828960 [Lactarius quietus]|nr:hypothetical protein EI94DRAFT_828960 [Lactarius quietus]
MNRQCSVLLHLSVSHIANPVQARWAELPGNFASGPREKLGALFNSLHAPLPAETDSSFSSLVSRHPASAPSLGCPRLALSLFGLTPLLEAHLRPAPSGSHRQRYTCQVDGNLEASTFNYCYGGSCESRLWQYWHCSTALPACFHPRAGFQTSPPAGTNPGGQ